MTLDARHRSIAISVIVYQIDPLTDGRWNHFIQSHPQSSVFHTRAWLSALRKAYGYEPIALTSSAPEMPLVDGLVLSRVDSWATGKRLVSLPFSDHCEPLLNDAEILGSFCDHLTTEVRRNRYQYFELRPLNGSCQCPPTLSSSSIYCIHQLDLRPTSDEIFKRFHKDSTQRKIRRAEREGLIYREGRSEDLLQHFYRLLIRTRRRHHIPPQPLSWFRNVISELGNDALIRIAFHADVAVAAILTLQHRDTLTYKYGCSDETFNALGGTQFLFWNAIQQAKDESLTTFDLGRSELANSGLITFKNRLGALQLPLIYWRYPHGPKGFTDYHSSKPNWLRQCAERTFTHMPDPVVVAIGKLLYRHIG